MDNSERALKTVHENSSHAKRERKLIIKLGKLATVDFSLNSTRVKILLNQAILLRRGLNTRLLMSKKLTIEWAGLGFVLD